MNLSELAFYSCLVFIVKFSAVAPLVKRTMMDAKITHAMLEFDFTCDAFFQAGIPPNDKRLITHSDLVWIRKYTETDQIDVLRRSVVEGEGIDTNNVLISFKCDEVEPAFMYNTVANIIVPTESGRRHYHFYFGGGYGEGYESTKIFMANIRPMPVKGEVRLYYEIISLGVYEENMSHKSPCVEKSAFIYERKLKTGKKSFSVRGLPHIEVVPTRVLQTTLLIVSSGQFRVSAVHKKSITNRYARVCLILDRGADVLHIFSFRTDDVASNFTNFMKNYASEEKLIEFKKDWMVLF